MAETKYYQYKKENQLGNIGLSAQVFSLITKIAIEEVKDVSLGVPKKGIVNMYKDTIKCDLTDSHVAIEAEVNIKYGKNVNKTIKALQDHISKAISDMTDVKTSSINIKIVGVDF